MLNIWSHLSSESSVRDMKWYKPGQMYRRALLEPVTVAKKRCNLPFLCSKTLCAIWSPIFRLSRRERFAVANSQSKSILHWSKSQKVITYSTITSSSFRYCAWIFLPSYLMKWGMSRLIVNISRARPVSFGPRTSTVDPMLTMDIFKLRTLLLWNAFSPSHVLKTSLRRTRNDTWLTVWHIFHGVKHFCGMKEGSWSANIVMNI